MDLPLSIVLITYNEAKRLPAALNALPPGAEIIILDSGSTDSTKEIALSFGAKFYQKPFSNYAEQKNAAIDLASRQWVLSLDSDEVCDERLVTNLLAVIKQDNQIPAAYSLKRKLVFLGKKMRFGKTCDRPIRLFQKGKARFEGSIHEKLLLLQPCITKPLKGTLWHHSYKDLSDYLTKLNRYTSLIGEQKRSKLSKTKNIAGFYLSHLLRPYYEFFHRFILRGGFLDGYHGYLYALLSSFYAFMKGAKTLEALREVKPEKNET